MPLRDGDINTYQFTNKWQLCNWHSSFLKDLIMACCYFYCLCLFIWNKLHIIRIHMATASHVNRFRVWSAWKTVINGNKIINLKITPIFEDTAQVRRHMTSLKMILTRIKICEESTLTNSNKRKQELCD
jgi:hypothetical protein